MNKPLYQIIYDDLKAKILSGELTKGAQLPTEKELSLTYNVSRITSKRALSELESSGLIYREQGRGSFVKSHPQTNDTSTNGKILFAIPFAHDLSLGNFYEGISPLIKKKNFDLLMTPSNFLETTSAEDLMSDFSGLVYYADKSDNHLDLLFSLKQAHFPVVVLDQPIADLNFPTITSDNFYGGKLATQALIDQQHRKIGYIFGSIPSPQTVRQRYLGYLATINEYRFNFHTKYNDNHAQLKNAVHYIEENALTAVVCENDLVAIALIKLLQQVNIQVPEKVSVIGFDDIQAAQLVSPSLTTIAQNFSLLGKIAGEQIISLIQNGYPDTVVQQQIEVTLIERESTK